MRRFSIALLWGLGWGFVFVFMMAPLLLWLTDETKLTSLDIRLIAVGGITTVILETVVTLQFSLGKQKKLR